MEQETACSSTEEMLAAFQEVNESGALDQHCVVGSLDVKALYPSLDVPFVSRVVADMFLSSNVSVPSVDTKELGLYLALNRTPDELRELGLLDFCPRRRTNRGRPPTMTGCATEEQEDKRFKPWVEAHCGDPDDVTKKKMLAEALSIGVQFVMSNHLYMFNGVARKQSKGGPIGLALTGDVAQVFMCYYDRELIKKMEGLGLELLLYRRYVDDINIIVRVLRALVNTPLTSTVDAIVMADIGREAGTIHISIQVTVDCPSFHEDKKLPILDLKVWLQRGQEDGSPVLILHEYYYKEIATRAVVDRRSAVPTETKRIVLTQEVLRILRNCSRQLPWGIVCDHVQSFSARMQFSGHGQRMRAKVVQAAVSAYGNQVKRDEAGEVPLYRRREWKKSERVKKKRSKKSGWFKGRRGQNESVVFVPATPSSVLKRRYLHAIQNSGINIAVVEVPGRSLKKRVQRSDPFKSDVCGRADSCMVCSGRRVGRSGKACRTEGVTYQIECVACGCVYVGETARNAYTRGLEHQTSVSRKDLTSPLYSHCVDQHNDSPVEFQMEVTGTFGGDALKRQITESVHIQSTPAHLLLNRRDEWRQTLLPRASFC